MAGLSLRVVRGPGVGLDQEARREGVGRSEVARTAIAEFLDRRERERYIAAFVAEARAAYADPTIKDEVARTSRRSCTAGQRGFAVAKRVVNTARQRPQVERKRSADETRRDLDRQLEPRPRQGDRQDQAGCDHSGGRASRRSGADGRRAAVNDAGLSRVQAVAHRVRGTDSESHAKWSSISRGRSTGAYRRRPLTMLYSCRARAVERVCALLVLDPRASSSSLYVAKGQNPTTPTSDGIFSDGVTYQMADGDAERDDRRVRRGAHGRHRRVRYRYS